jgi:hypothetical protein
MIVPQGPHHWSRNSEEWLFVVSGEELDASQPEEMLPWAREAIGIPDLEAKILGVSEWYMESLLANDFRAGRVFLLGDATPFMFSWGVALAVMSAATPMSVKISIVCWLSRWPLGRVLVTG